MNSVRHIARAQCLWTVLTGSFVTGTLHPFATYLLVLIPYCGSSWALPKFLFFQDALPAHSGLVQGALLSFPELRQPSVPVPLLTLICHLLLTGAWSVYLFLFRELRSSLGADSLGPWHLPAGWSWYNGKPAVSAQAS